MKAERGTEPPIQFSASWARAVILEYYQKTGRAGRCCLCFQVLVLGNCLCERMRGMQVGIGDSLQPPARHLFSEGRELQPLSIAHLSLPLDNAGNYCT